MSTKKLPKNDPNLGSDIQNKKSQMENKDKSLNSIPNK
jgi:hypothetical protein